MIMGFLLKSSSAIEALYGKYVSFNSVMWFFGSKRLWMLVDSLSGVICSIWLFLRLNVSSLDRSAFSRWSSHNVSFTKLNAFFSKDSNGFAESRILLRERKKEIQQGIASNPMCRQRKRAERVWNMYYLSKSQPSVLVAFITRLERPFIWSSGLLGSLNTAFINIRILRVVAEDWNASSETLLSGWTQWTQWFSNQGANCCHLGWLCFHP